MSMNRSLFVGKNAGANARDCEGCIVIGDNIDLPHPDARFYINIDGKEYPNSVRFDPAFRMLVERRAREVAAENGYFNDLDLSVFFSGQCISH